MEEGDQEMIGEIDWDNLLFELESPDFANILENSTTEPEPEKASEQLPLPLSPDGDGDGDGDAVLSARIGEIEKVLMEDEQFDDKVAFQSISDDFFADIILVDSPLSVSGEVIDDADADADAASHKQNNSDNNIHDHDHDDDNNDPFAKKRKRQLRNRDAAVRSRERKKMYVRDLEMKSRYLEGECRRLGRMLQCFIAENQALRLTLHKGYAFDASSAKQESAVLLLESLLLGSLLWFLGIMCLFTLPTLPMPRSPVKAVPLENEQWRGPESVAPRGARINLVGLSLSRRCRASRTKMKKNLQRFSTFIFTYHHHGLVV